MNERKDTELIRKSDKVWLCLLESLIIAAGIGLDQFTKYLAVRLLKDQEPIPLISGVLELRYLENRGAAFGIMQNQKIFFLIMTVVILTAIVYVWIRMPVDRKYRSLRLILAFIAAGAVGNMIDRVRLDYVVDFIYISLIDFPIFNVADMFVSLSCVAAAVMILFGKNLKDEDFKFLFPDRKEG